MDAAARDVATLSGDRDAAAPDAAATAAQRPGSGAGSDVAALSLRSPSPAAVDPRGAISVGSLFRRNSALWRVKGDNSRWSRSRRSARSEWWAPAPWGTASPRWRRRPAIRWSWSTRRRRLSSAAVPRSARGSSGWSPRASSRPRSATRALGRLTAAGDLAALARGRPRGRGGGREAGGQAERARRARPHLPAGDHPRHQHQLDLHHQARGRHRPAREGDRHALHEPGAGDAADRGHPRPRHQPGDLRRRRGRLPPHGQDAGRGPRRPRLRLQPGAHADDQRGDLLPLRGSRGSRRPSTRL